MARDFSASVTCGLMLSKRLYYGKGASPAPAVMSRSFSSTTESYLPTAVMAYAVVTEPAMVDNPDVPSYQPYVHGRCDPPALIPLHMHEVSMEVDCCLDTAFVTVSGAWRVHCIMAGRRCDCRIAIPMGQQGSLLGVEVNVSESDRSYNSTWVTFSDSKETGQTANSGDGYFLAHNIYTFRIPQVDGGSNISVKVSWSQKLSYQDGQFCLNVPFSFPAYVNPAGKKIAKREKIQLNVNSCTGTELLIKCGSHPLKELSRDVHKLCFIYEAEVPAWSTIDLKFAYTVSSSDIFGQVFLQSPPLHDFDEREMFFFYLFPGNNQNRKVFNKEVVFVVDISESMQGRPIENIKNSLLASLSKLNPQDSFNIIAFNSEVHLFSSTMVHATHGSILNATHWLSSNLTADGGTNIMLALKQAMKLLSDTSDSIPLIFLITDGSVEDEREICNVMKGYLTTTGSIAPRICTFGIGLYCNHYFLQMLAQIGRGHYDCTYDVDNIESRMERLFTTASSVVVANITLDMPQHLDSLELFPSHIPDLSFGSPLIVSGRYKGEFPDVIKINGTLEDMSAFQTDLKLQNAKDLPFDRILTRRQIDIITCHAWLSESKELEEKVAKISLQTSFPSEYTHMVLHQADSGKKVPESTVVREMFNKINLSTKGDPNGQKIIILGCLGVGFGNLTATAKNIPPGIEEPKSPEGAEILCPLSSASCVMNAMVYAPCENSANQQQDHLVKITEDAMNPEIQEQPCSVGAKTAKGKGGCDGGCLGAPCFDRQIKVVMTQFLTRSLFFSMFIVFRFCSSNGSDEEERTLGIIKPDGISGNYTERIKQVILESGFEISKEMVIQLDEENAANFYAEHSSKSFFTNLIRYMTSGPVLVMVLEKEDAVARWRDLIGPTDAGKAKITHPHSIRAMCGVDLEKNCVHGSDSHQSAEREIAFFFKEAPSEDAVGKHDEL
ncbi:hypothetical protein V6N13_033846 [Hibiscus sabdariffa]